MTHPKNALTVRDVRAKREAILRLAGSLGFDNVRVFGSVARNEASEQSDVDFLVDLQADVHGFAYFGLIEDLRKSLSDLLGQEVHVVDSASLSTIRQRVLQEAVPL